MNGMRMLVIAVVVFLTAGVAGCGSSGSGPVALPDTFSCPQWNLGDSMVFLRTETVGTVSSSATSTVVVAARTNLSAVLSDNTGTWTYAVSGGKYIPLTEELASGATTSWSSTTAFCPPPGKGAAYEYTTWIPSPTGRGGDYETRTLTVTAVSKETLSVPTGSFAAHKLTMADTTISPSPILPDSVVTRYYVSGIGMVKEVETMTSGGTTTTVTRELTSYSYQ